MPDVTGQSVSDAKTRLARLGVINVDTDPPGGVNEIVVSQEPLVGKLITQSQSVRLITKKQ
jgi:beta-lactam-binding protein with PASTA domain